MTVTDGFVAEIDRLWELPAEEAARGADAVDETIRLLDAGEIRVAEKRAESWAANEWVKKAILLYFRLKPAWPIEVGPFQYFDKVPVSYTHLTLPTNSRV